MAEPHRSRIFITAVYLRNGHILLSLPMKPFFDPFARPSTLADQSRFEPSPANTASPAATQPPPALLRPRRKVIVGIRAMPGSGKIRLSGNSRNHYNAFSRGPLSAYLFLCSEQDFPTPSTPSN